VLNLPQKTFNSIKNKLLRQQKELEEELQDIQKEDEEIIDGPPESQEPGTASWMAEVHGRVSVARDSIVKLLSNTKQALTNLRTGKYGKCENCGKVIEKERLEAIPTATLCLSCSKKPKK
jgi:DnaK suppressor protein